MKRLIFILCLISTNAFAADEEWLKLLHYQKKTFGGYESTVGSSDFFLTKDGKKEPDTELKAAIDLFDSKGNIEKKCLFPARYRYLKARGLVKAEEPNCKEFIQFYKDLSPSGVTLLFTDAYMNNPSSLFGHTLFRIDTARKGTQLLAHGVNYGAMTGDDGGVLFAVLGLTGGYMGSFTVKPYYDVINTYNNIENRDIWELNLNLSPSELDMFVAHLWELGHSHTPYFFFSRNCSYMLMETLDAVRPGLDLASEFPFHTIPLDTFKAVAAKKELVKGLSFRPSRQSKIVYQYEQMNAKQRGAYSEVVKKGKYDRLSKLSSRKQAGVLDTAYQYLQYQNVEGEIDRADYRQKSFDILSLRSKLGVKDSLKQLSEGEPPLKTHNSMRATVGSGFRNGEAFQEISYRPAYHSLTDNGNGYLKGAEINFLNSIWRHYDNQNKYVLHEFDLVGIKSLSPVNEMFFPYSYQIDAKLTREMNPKTEEEGYVGSLAFAGGMTYELNKNVWVYALLGPQAAYGGFLPHDNWVGLGGKVGTLAEFDDFRLLAEIERVEASTKFGSKTKYSLEATYTLTTNTSLAVNYLYEDKYGRNVSEPMMSFRYHFY